MNLFTDLLPVRKATVWSVFSDDSVIPHRYGEVGGVCLPYNAERTSFVWADHPVKSIHTVTVGGQAVSNWKFRNGLDYTGSAVAFVDFDAPVDRGAEVVAFGVGKLDSLTGLPIVNPADVITDILTKIATVSVGGRLGRFKQQCLARGYVVSGSIASHESIQKVVRGVSSSFDAVMAADASSLCYFLDDVDATTHLSDSEYTLTASTSLADLHNGMLVEYQYVQGSPKQSLICESPSSIRVYGRLIETVSLPWVGTSRVALLVATSRMRRQARPYWDVEVSGVHGRINCGESVHVISRVLLSEFTAPVVRTSFNVEKNQSQLRVTIPVGVEPDVVLLRVNSKATEPQYAGVSLDTVGDSRILKVFNSDGTPAINVEVVLNLTLSRFSDGTGKVSFPVSQMPPGTHRLDIKGPVPFSVEVTV